MSMEIFLKFIACLLFSMFNLHWQPKFTYPRLRWIPFALVCAGVVGAGLVFAGVL